MYRVTLSDVAVAARREPDKIDWEYISKYRVLTEDFLREFADKIYWRYISVGSEGFSEDFLREFADRVNWNNVMFFQILSDDFITEMQLKGYLD